MPLSRRCAFLALVVGPLTACAGNPSKAVSDGGIDGSADAIGNPCGDPDPAVLATDPADLFGRTKIPTFDFYLPPAAWADLQAHARDEIYVPAQACLDGKAIGQVGLRFKGSYGSLYNCFDATGKNVYCRKLGMKVKLDEYVDGQRLGGLERLNFQGYRYDSSYLKESLTYDLYRSMGIVTPRTSWAKVRVNGDPQGLFGMVEDVDDRFVKDCWPTNSDGNLFKEIWPGQTDDTWLTSRLHTNEKAPDISAIKAFSAALNAAAIADLRATFGAYVDLDYWARYMAVDDAVANYDGVTTYYTSGAPDGAGNHNFYLYQESPTKFTVIPWDEESTLSTAANFGNVPYWQTVPADCSLTYGVWGGANQVVAPGCDRVFRALAADTSAWKTYAQQVLDGPFAVTTMTANIDTLATFLREEAKSDPHGPGVTEFDKAVGLLKQDLPRLRARLQHLMSGLPSTPLVLMTTAINTFDTADAYGLTDGTMMLCNPSSTMSVELDTATPISGTETVRVDFNFGNETTTYQQWMLYTVPYDKVPKDLGGFTGIRMKMSANAPRGVRLNILSPNCSKTDQGIEPGWDVNVTTTPQTYTVLFADAKTPAWAVDPGDSLALILKTSSGLQWMPQCIGRDASGQLPAGATDIGWLDIDDVEYF